MTYQDILDAAKLLDPSDQIRLVHAICEVLPPTSGPAPDDSWISEVERRSAALDDGTMSASPWREVMERTDRRAGLNG
jgi:putative addiction module component (TIGR02574 family)